MLTQQEIKNAMNAKSPKVGLHADGGGLYLQVTASGGASWIYRYQVNGRRRGMGLGSLSVLPLMAARAKAAEIREKVKHGGDAADPIDARRAEREAVKAAAEAVAEAEAKKANLQSTTFKAVALDYVESKRAGWKNLKHAEQWVNTLTTYAFPHIGAMSVADVDVADVLKVLKPIWKSKTETASRVRSRLELVLDAAQAAKLRHGENPARWRGHLEHLLPPPRKVTPVKNHPAVPYKEMPAFMQQLRLHDGTSALCLEFAILTAARSSEALQAAWSEIDLLSATWTIPKERMKAAREHRVPLTEAALAVLAKAGVRREGLFVFPGVRSGRPMTDMALTMLLRDIRTGVTVHGFRSTFRDWVAEMTEYPNELAEMALAHAISSKSEAAYRRGDMLDRRRPMMADWMNFIGADKGAGDGSTDQDR